MVLIGDTDHDAEVVRSLGIDCILIPEGFQAQIRLESADFPVVKSLYEVGSGWGLFSEGLPETSQGIEDGSVTLGTPPRLLLPFQSVARPPAIQYIDAVFRFGKNWKSFAGRALSPEHVDHARADFRKLVDGIELSGSTFLDVGFGQGLIACLADEAGASVTALDVDRDNLEALEMTRRFFPDTVPIKTTIGSILDERVVSELGTFDVVHSWGVLHHTGDLWTALKNTVAVVRPGGSLILGLYNRHWTSPVWWGIKRTYNLVPPPVQRLMINMSAPVLGAAFTILRGERTDVKHRGMDFRHDVVDWIGGYPYEYCSVQDVLSRLQGSFEVVRTLRPLVPTGNNGFILRRKASPRNL